MSGERQKRITYLDSCVLIHAAKALRVGADSPAVAAAWRVLGDSSRVFVVSPVLELELLPASEFLLKRMEAKQRRADAGRIRIELEFYHDFLQASSNQRVELSPLVVSTARSLASSVDRLGVADALHAAVAAIAGAEFITDEAIEKPVHRLDEKRVKVTQLLQAGVETK